MLRILVGKDLTAAQQIVLREGKAPIATIEAEYGNTVVEGVKATYAHHVAPWTTAPSLQKNNGAFSVEDILDSSNYILVSHIDLDVICGILSILNAYDVRDAVKEAVNYIDCNGQHKLGSVKDPEGKAFIESYIGIISKFRAPVGTEDVTDYCKMVGNILMGNREKDTDWAELGARVLAQKETEASKATVLKNNGVVLYDAPENVFGLNSAYTVAGEEFGYTVVYSNKFKTITVAAAAGKDQPIDMVDFMQGQFGSAAGGHYGIAGSPRGVEYTLADAMNVFEAITKIV